jgi:hypothetical protein
LKNETKIERRKERQRGREREKGREREREIMKKDHDER